MQENKNELIKIFRIISEATNEINNNKNNTKIVDENKNTFSFDNEMRNYLSNFKNVENRMALTIPTAIPSLGICNSMMLNSVSTNEII